MAFALQPDWPINYLLNSIANSLIDTKWILKFLKRKVFRTDGESPRVSSLALRRKLTLVQSTVL